MAHDLETLNGPRPWVIYLVAAALFFGTSVFGPFEYHVYSTTGLIYFAAVNLMFFMGLVLGPHIFLSKKKIPQHRSYELRGGYQTAAWLASVIGIVAGCVLIIRMVSQTGVIYDSVSEFEEPRTLVDQVLTVLMRFGIVGFLFGRVFDMKETKAKKGIRLLGLLLPGVYYLLTGRRFVAAAVFLMYFMVNIGRRSRSRFLTKPLSHYLKWLVIAVTAISLFYLFVDLMGVRRIISPLRLYLLVPGDQNIKSGWDEFYYQGGSFSQQLFNLADYIAQAPYYFSLFWERFLSGLGHQYYLSQLLRPIQTILGMFNVHIVADASQYFADLGGNGGRYAGFVWPMIVDFGVYLTPVAAFMFGVIFSKVDQYRHSSYVCNAFYPCVAVMCFFAPIYYFNIASMDWIVFQSTAFILLLKMLGFFPAVAIANVGEADANKRT